MSAGSFAHSARPSVAANREFIIAQAEKGYPASAIARMTGCHQADVAVLVAFLRKPKDAPPSAPEAQEAPPRPLIKDPAPSRARRVRAPSDKALSILTPVAAYYGLTVEELTGHAMPKVFAEPREQACWRLRQAGFSYNRIGQVMGGRDHSTIMTSCERYERRMALLSEAA